MLFPTRYSIRSIFCFKIRGQNRLHSRLIGVSSEQSGEGGEGSEGGGEGGEGPGLRDGEILADGETAVDKVTAAVEAEAPWPPTPQQLLHRPGK
jgi:hypothetical protein